MACLISCSFFLFVSFILFLFSILFPTFYVNEVLNLIHNGTKHAGFLLSFDILFLLRLSFDGFFFFCNGLDRSFCLLLGFSFSCGCLSCSCFFRCSYFCCGGLCCGGLCCSYLLGFCCGGGLCCSYLFRCSDLCCCCLCRGYLLGFCCGGGLCCS